MAQTFEPKAVPWETLPMMPGVRYRLIHAVTQIDKDDPTLDTAHIHGYYEIYVNRAGDVAFLVNNRLYPVESGDVVFSFPTDTHYCLYRSSCRHDHYCLWWECPAESPLAEYLAKPVFAAHRVHPENKEKLFSLLSRLENASGVERTEAFLRIFTYLSGAFPAAAAEDLPQDVQKMLDYIEANFTKITSVEEIAAHFFISYATMHRRFSRALGISPKKLLEAKKLTYAKELLDRGATVTDACFGAGFGDCSHFIAVFKKHFGTTPLRARKSDKD